MSNAAGVADGGPLGIQRVAHSQFGKPHLQQGGEFFINLRFNQYAFGCNTALASIDDA